MKLTFKNGVIMVPSSSLYINKCDGFSKYINKLSNNDINGDCIGVYIGTNEDLRKCTFESLAKTKAPSEACHIGVSSWFNFDIIASRRSSRAILMDFNPNIKTFLLETLNWVITSNSIDEFSVNISKYIKKNKTYFSTNNSEEIEYSGSIENEVFTEMKIANNWLNKGEKFNYIKKLASEGKIAIITEDIRSYEKFERISNVIQENGYFLDTLYVSNIADYMTTENDKKCFTKSIDCLTRHGTQLIHCPVEKWVDGRLKQKVTLIDESAKSNLNGLLFPEIKLFQSSKK